MLPVITSDMVNGMPIFGLVECIASDYAVSLTAEVVPGKHALGDMHKNVCRNCKGLLHDELIARRFTVSS